jgi:hypothetical protein
MSRLVDFPFLLLAVAVAVLWISAYAGDFLSKRWFPLKENERDYFGVVLTASLTLLALIIGFTFSMAISRYDMRKNYEEAEANAIGTELVRADLLPAGDAVKVRDLLLKYLSQRVAFYETRDERQLEQIRSRTAGLQTDLWSAVKSALSSAQPTPVVALAITGMNDVSNAEGYAQAAAWNRIPLAAWLLIAAVAICCSMLLGYDARETDPFLFLVLPIVVSIALFLIADIDSPRGGFIRVLPLSLERLAHSMESPGH